MYISSLKSQEIQITNLVGDVVHRLGAVLLHPRRRRLAGRPGGGRLLRGRGLSRGAELARFQEGLHRGGGGLSFLF